MKIKDLLLAKIVFETRYKQGYRYLDRCGEMMIEIENELKNWRAREAQISSCQMVNPSENMFFNCSSLKLDLSQDTVKELECKSFLSYSRQMFNIVSKNLGIKEYIRFGLRYWFLLPVDSIQSGQKILTGNSLFNVDTGIEVMFDKKVKDKSFVVILEKEKYGHRIALSVVHKQGFGSLKDQNEFLTTTPHKLPKGQKEALIAQLERKKRQQDNPDVAVLLDIDNYMEDPEAANLDNFITSSVELTMKNAIKLIEGK